MAIPAFVVFDPLNQITNSMAGGSAFSDPRISPIGTITYGFLWGGFDPWVQCDGVTTTWDPCMSGGVTTAWQMAAGVTTSWTECL